MQTDKTRSFAIKNAIRKETFAYGHTHALTQDLCNINLLVLTPFLLRYAECNNGNRMPAFLSGLGKMNTLVFFTVRKFCTGYSMHL